MATSKYATKKLSINNAQAFIDAVRASDTSTDKKSTILYAVLGGTKPWNNEPNPDDPPRTTDYTNFELHREFIGGKKIGTDDVCHVVPRYNWTSGTIYSMYRNSDANLFEKQFYVVNSELSVYKCLNNNRGAPSTVEPTGYSTVSFTSSDGYTWKYMYTIPLGLADKFLTAVHMPVRTIEQTDNTTESDRQVDVQQAAVNGAIEIVELNNKGSGYYGLVDAQVAIATETTIRLSTSGVVTPELTDGFYTGASLYITSGTGAGQLRRIVNYDGSLAQITVNTDFQTTPENDSLITISPTVNIIGDGRNAKAYAILNGTEVANVAVINVGEKYSRADVYISSNSELGSGASANAYIAPTGGHGSNAVEELFADKVAMNVQFDGKEGNSSTGKGYIPADESLKFRTVTLLKDPILKVNQNNDLLNSEEVANTSNSPETLRFTTRCEFIYESDSAPRIIPNDTLTNENFRLQAELGSIEFQTELDLQDRRDNAMRNALRTANGNVVYIEDDENLTDPEAVVFYLNNVNSYSTYRAFIADDVILRYPDETKVGRIQFVRAPEANTYSGEVLYTENLEVVSRNTDQIEDIKIVLDF